MTSGDGGSPRVGVGTDAPVACHDEAERRGTPSPSIAQLRVRRVLDFLLSVVLLVLLAIPIMLITVLVAVSSKGPVLFRQLRVGKNGRPFVVLKFRTMRVGTITDLAEDESARAAYVGNDFKLTADDPRITGVGRVLRRTSLDELPQLVNVFFGDMSLVGIRPLLADELALRSEDDQQLYETMRPGMTGLWQVEGRSNVVFEDRVALDRRYVETWSLWNDAKIILRTPLALIRSGNAY